jgi:hypothetical protein
MSNSRNEDITIMKKRIGIIVVAMIVMLSVVTIHAYVPAAEVYIYTNQSSAFSGSFGLTKKAKYWAWNASSSSRNLYAILEYSIPGYGWTRGVVTNLSPGSEIDPENWSTLSLQSNASWRVELNPYGIGTTGCLGCGCADYND